MLMLCKFGSGELCGVSFMDFMCMDVFVLYIVLLCIIVFIFIIVDVSKFDLVDLVKIVIEVMGFLFLK